MTSRDEADDWLDVFRSVKGGDYHVYEVRPEVEGPWPWNGTGLNGYVSPGATVVRKIPTENSKATCWKCYGIGPCSSCNGTGQRDTQHILWGPEDAYPEQPKFAPTVEDLMAQASGSGKKKKKQKAAFKE